MFYRYEIRAGEDAPWKGCFQFFFPDQLRYIGRWLKEPKWYKKIIENILRVFGIK